MKYKVEYKTLENVDIVKIVNTRQLMDLIETMELFGIKEINYQRITKKIK